MSYPIEKIEGIGAAKEVEQHVAANMPPGRVGHPLRPVSFMGGLSEVNGRVRMAGITGFAGIAGPPETADD